MRNRLGVSIVALAAVWSAAAPGTARAQAGPTFDDTVLEMTSDTLDRFARALVAEEGSRKSIAAKAAAPVAKPTKTKEEYANCQMELMMSPEFQKVLQDVTAAVSGNGKDPAATQRAVDGMQGKVDAYMEKSCGPDPGKTHSKPDVGNLLRKAQAEAAGANGFTDRQFAMIKERVTPLCLADPVTNDSAGLRIPGEGRVFFVYTSDEVEALKPHCDDFMKLIVHPKQ